MCFNLSLTVRKEKLARIFGADPEGDWGPGFLLGAFDHPVVPLLMEVQGQKKFVLARWGLIPPGFSWEEGQKIRKKTLNARSETLGTRPSFRQAAEEGRALVPFTGFFEWQARGKSRIPYLVTFLRDGEVGALAGLAVPSPEPGGPPYTFTLITAPPNSLVSPMHDRSPLRLNSDDWNVWLDPRKTRDEVVSLMVNGEWPDMTLRRVGPLVSRIGEDRNRPEVLLPPGEEPNPVDGQGRLF